LITPFPHPLSCIKFLYSIIDIKLILNHIFNQKQDMEQKLTKRKNIREAKREKIHTEYSNEAAEYWILQQGDD